MTLKDYCIDTGDSYAFNAIYKTGSLYNGGRSIMVPKEVKSKKEVQWRPIPDYEFAKLSNKGTKLDISNLIN